MARCQHKSLKRDEKTKSSAEPAQSARLAAARAAAANRAERFESGRRLTIAAEKRAPAAVHPT
jgi:hypothetical protein